MAGLWWKLDRLRWKLTRPKWLRSRSERWRWRLAALIAVLALVLLACLALWLTPKFISLAARRRAANVPVWSEAAPEGEGLCVYFLDVGQADAAILTCGSETMVIDGGNVGDAELLRTMLRDVLGVKRIEHMIASHPHEDHVGGLSGALEACAVENFYTPLTEYDNVPFEITLKQASERGARIIVPKPGDSFSLGDARVDILGPLGEYDDVNDMSIVCRVSYGSTAFLFGGDMGRAAEEDLLCAGARLRADVLKVSHHGSDSSSTAAFLKAVRPSWAIVSVGTDNDYDHPSRQVLRRLNAVGAAALCTDDCGAIRCVSDGEAITVACSGAAGRE